MAKNKKVKIPLEIAEKWQCNGWNREKQEHKNFIPELLTYHSDIQSVELTDNKTSVVLNIDGRQEHRYKTVPVSILNELIGAGVLPEEALDIRLQKYIPRPYYDSSEETLADIIIKNAYDIK